MVDITIKGVPGDLHRKLKDRARRHRRSLNAEVISTLEELIYSRPLDPQEFLPEVRELRSRVRKRLTDNDLSEFKALGRS